MPTSNENYDHALLADAQAPTRSQLQEGYNADILRPNRTPPIRSATDPDSTRSRSSPASKEHLPVPVTHTKRQSWWRTRKGALIIGIIALVIIGAVVGGAVGGTVGRKDNDNDSDAEDALESALSSSAQPGPTVSGANSQPIAAPTPTNGSDGGGDTGAAPAPSPDQAGNEESGPVSG